MIEPWMVNLLLLTIIASLVFDAVVMRDRLRDVKEDRDFWYQYGVRRVEELDEYERWCRSEGRWPQTKSADDGDHHWN